MQISISRDSVRLVSIMLTGFALSLSLSHSLAVANVYLVLSAARAREGTLNEMDMAF